MDVLLEANGVSRLFEFSHAERLLKMKNNGGWKLADKNFIYDTEKNVIIRAGKGKSKISAKGTGDINGDESGM